VRYAVFILALATSCSPTADRASPADTKSAALVRAARRAYDGAPPTIPHAPMGAECIACHNARGLAVAGVGFAPPSPHELTPGLSSTSRCEQCHVYKRLDALFVQNEFVPLAQDLRPGTRLYSGAPPVMPHAMNMRENCQACHSGPAAREEIRCSHPERPRCEQCHVPSTTASSFQRL
jgi:cytochrome c-type protein NapB